MTCFHKEVKFLIQGQICVVKTSLNISHSREMPECIKVVHRLMNVILTNSLLDEFS